MKTLQEIYSTLKQLIKTEDIDKKNGLDYISWSVAYEYMLKSGLQFDIDYKNYELKILPNNTVLIQTTIIVEGISKSMVLPVMDYKNQAVANPDAVLINKNIQRCFVKNLALFGLGIQLYTGEDLPNENDITSPATKANQPVNREGKVWTKPANWIPKDEWIKKQNEMKAKAPQQPLEELKEEIANWWEENQQ